MLGQVLSRVLLGQPGTVQQLPLKKRQVGLQKETAPHHLRSLNNCAVCFRQHSQEQKYHICIFSFEKMSKKSHTPLS